MSNQEVIIKQIKNRISQIENSDELIELAVMLKGMQLEAIKKLEEEKINE